VVLAHLSEMCNTEELALRTMKAALGRTAFAGTIVVARQDAPTAPIDVGAATVQLALPLGRTG
jgi:hypothetical protein